MKQMHAATFNLGKKKSLFLIQKLWKTDVVSCEFPLPQLAHFPL